MVADATLLNKNELLLKMVHFGLLQNTRTKTAHKQHTKQDKHTTHQRFYTCFFNNGGPPKGRIRDDERLSNF